MRPRATDACKKNGRTVSRVLSWAIIYLSVALPIRFSGLPAGIGRTIHLLLGFAPDEVFPAGPVTKTAVGSYPTFSPLPLRAVCFLWHFL